MTIDNTEDVRGEWPIRTAWLIPIVLVFAGLVGACDPPKASGAEPRFIDDYSFAYDIGAALEAFNPCPAEDPSHDAAAPYDRDAIAACVRWVWPDETEDRALSVVFGRTMFPNARCRVGESNGNQNAVGRNYRNGKLRSTDHGPMQMNSGNRRALEAAGFDWSAVQWDPETNIRAGLWLYESTRNGWRNWACARTSWPRHG